MDADLRALGPASRTGKEAVIPRRGNVDIGVLQAPPPTCQCEAILRGTTSFGTRLNIDICPDCQLGSSVFHVENAIVGVFDLRSLETLECVSTSEGLKLTVSGTGVATATGEENELAFEATFVDGTFFDFLIDALWGESSGEGPFPTVTRCSIVRFRGLGRTATQL